MKLISLKYAIHPDIHDKRVETRIIIFKDGKIEDVRPRCLGNFKNYTVVGILEGCEKDGIRINTYSLIATPNLPEFYKTLVCQDAKTQEIPKYFGTVEKYDEELIKKAITIRAKDIMYD